MFQTAPVIDTPYDGVKVRRLKMPEQIAWEEERKADEKGYIQGLLVRACVYEDGKPVFASIADVNKLDWFDVEQLFTVASSYNNVTLDDIKALKKKFLPMPASDQPSNGQ